MPYERTYGNAISHVQVKSINPERQALPITSTGYRSHFLPIGTVEANGGDVVQQVLDWIDEEAAKPDWTARETADRQGDLFG